MINQIQAHGLILNFIIYVIIVLPLILISSKKSIYETKRKFISYLVISIILEIILSIILYIFSREIFSIFTSITGVINYAVHSSKILFITSSLYSIKILVPAYLQKHNKKTAILVLSKIAANIIFIFIGYSLFDTKGILYSIPICDLIYYIIYSKIFLNIFR